MALLIGWSGSTSAQSLLPRVQAQAGRLVAGFIALGLASLTAGLVLSLLGLPGGQWAWLGQRSRWRSRSSSTTPARIPSSPRSRSVSTSASARRCAFNTSASRSAFTILVLTGMPAEIRRGSAVSLPPSTLWRFEGARIAHRAAAILMTGVWLWHFGFLIYRWKRANFSCGRDHDADPQRLHDFFHTIRYGLGLTHERPLYDRFQWREKFDYFAVYWGMPIMIFSGAVLWWPVFWGNRLTDLGLAIAFLAHSDEALLAMLAIAIWHLYNTHLDPEHFPMNPVWYSGVLSESEMEREHPPKRSDFDKKEHNA